MKQTFEYLASLTPEEQNYVIPDPLFRVYVSGKGVTTGSPCGKIAFRIKANGDVTPCGYYDHIVTGNVHEIEGLRKAWESIEMQKIKQTRIKDISECRDCSLLRTCGTGCRAIADKINGGTHSKDPYACRTAPLLEEYIAVSLKQHGFNMEMSDGCSEYSITENNPL